ncbi:hypothetical protein [Niveispirillum cyanobacteriorum]|uniref:Uncharacterized protein n=1 Tax=Niveispirillum cyanobacteriorum TaxID=1612173 RepID=A0A2K9NFW6_9PROT|nr:hypothetical protein [Niveispirillum cyanobacteriorum]AUN31967.1 hypothetical protein C0V82_16185 [Niveispirillum cyanobacteriorum]GGE85374.1 hypothetical protein GCM10011317_48180 [Niveispirillum cyanobacteriorum]
MRNVSVGLICLGVLLILGGWIVSPSEPYSTTVTLHRLFTKLSLILTGGFACVTGAVTLLVSDRAATQPTPMAPPAATLIGTEMQNPDRPTATQAQAKPGGMHESDKLMGITVLALVLLGLAAALFTRG